VVIGNEGKRSFLKHSLIDLIGEFLFVFLFERLDFFPLLVLDALAFFLMLAKHFFDFERKFLFLVFELALLYLEVAVHLFEQFFVFMVHFSDHCLETFKLFVTLGCKIFKSDFISLLLFLLDMSSLREISLMIFGLLF
jgi:hypothetical protein